jgi:hypothetical protein
VRRGLVDAQLEITVGGRHATARIVEAGRRAFIRAERHWFALGASLLPPADTDPGAVGAALGDLPSLLSGAVVVPSRSLHGHETDTVHGRLRLDLLAYRVVPVTTGQPGTHDFQIQTDPALGSADVDLVVDRDDRVPRRLQLTLHLVPDPLDPSDAQHRGRLVLAADWRAVAPFQVTPPRQTAGDLRALIRNDPLVTGTLFTGPQVARCSFVHCET